MNRTIYWIDGNTWGSLSWHLVGVLIDDFALFIFWARNSFRRELGRV